MSKSESSLFPISPAGRSTLIMMTFLFGLVGMTSYWVLKEARSIERQKNLTREANAHFENDMVWIPAGKFTMGGIGDDVPADELPLHDVKVDGFYLDRHEVTNAEFAKFVQATGYVTGAERPLSAKTTPGLPPELEGKSASRCFRALPPGAKADQPWELVIGVNWRHPSGPASSIEGRDQHPVVQVCYEDAMAYCKWDGKRLPTEAEWEYAARGGLVARPFVWGSEMLPRGKWMANIWQGHFPDEPSNLDGFAETAPVGSFPANGFGLYDMSGNVWELTEDWYRPDTYALLLTHPEREARHNPQGPKDSLDPDEPGVWKKTARGGSWLSDDGPHGGYRPSARLKIAPNAGRQDLGFRCVKDGPPPK